ncbi:MAG: hypothetical protein BRC25_01405 [Parcubacteria group bacterium SW_6_46_9]|nr:MAG: hypothetical protein BRC25_01405 [Parcubacteria group bacterium SW_6_46_9]
MGTLMLLVAAGPAVAYSQTTASDQLQNLRKQVNQIQQQLVSQENQHKNNSRVSKARPGGELGLSNQTLQRGDSGPAVKNLQAAINAIPEITVSDSGPGSVGSETTYFGPKTEQAVSEFQSRYKDGILTPLGLRSSTGVVGSRTKRKLSAVISNSGTSQNPTGPDQISSRTNTDDRYSGSKQSRSGNQRPDSSSSLSELRSKFTIDKWSFTQEEKRRIYNMMPPKIQKEHLSNFLEDTNTRSGSTDNTESVNPLQERYRELQSDNETSLKEKLKGYLALQQLKAPLGLLRRTLDSVFTPEKAHAQGVFIFGGRIASVEPCPTPPNALQVTVVGPRPGRFAFIPAASQIRPAYNVAPRPGMNTLGTHQHQRRSPRALSF